MSGISKREFGAVWIEEEEEVAQESHVGASDLPSYAENWPLLPPSSEPHIDETSLEKYSLLPTYAISPPFLPTKRQMKQTHLHPKCQLKNSQRHNNLPTRPKSPDRTTLHSSPAHSTALTLHSSQQTYVQEFPKIFSYPGSSSLLRSKS